MSPRPDVSEKRRNQILEAATQVFARLGFHDARMDDIVEEAGLSKGALYWYFKSKDDIIIGILDRMFRREIEDLRSLKDSEGPARERLLHFAEHTIDDFLKFERFLPLIFDFLVLAIRSKTIHKTFKNYFRDYLDIIIPIIQQGVDSGEFNAVDARSAALAMGAIFEGTILLWFYDSEAVDLMQTMKASIRLFLDGLTAREA